MITSFQDLLLAVGRLVGLIIPLIVALALLYFFWGLAQFIRNAGDEKAIAEGKSRMFWGIIVLFVMTSIWGIVNFLQDDLLGGDPPISYPINSRTLTP